MRDTDIDTDLSTSELAAFEWHGNSSGTETPLLVRQAIQRACAEIRRRRADEPTFASSIAPNETIDNYLRETNLKSHLEHEALKLGTDNQRERYAAGHLPQEELLALARESLFGSFKDIQRWKALGYAEVNHKGTCRARIDIMNAPLKLF